MGFNLRGQGGQSQPFQGAFCFQTLYVQLTQNENNFGPSYNGSLFSNAATLGLIPNGSYSITGLKGGFDGRVLYISNLGSVAITLSGESGSSDATNRFAAGSSIAAGATLELQYSGYLSRWVAVGSSGGGSISVGDGTTTVNPCTSVVFSQGVVTDSGGGVATIAPQARGVAFPSSPSTNQQFYRTDRNINYFYDGSNWLSETLYVSQVQTQGALNPFSGTTRTRVHNPWCNTYQLYIEKFSTSSILDNAATNANYFTQQLQYHPVGGVSTNIGAVISTQNNTTGAFVFQEVTVNASPSLDAAWLSVVCTEVGTAQMSGHFGFTYRLIG